MNENKKKILTKHLLKLSYYKNFFKSVKIFEEKNK